MRKSLALVLLSLLPLALSVPAFAIEKEARGYFGIVSGDTDDKGPALVIMPDGSINVNAEIDLQGATIQGGGTSMADDGAFTPGTTQTTPSACIYRSTRDLVDDGDAGACAMTQRRAQFVVPETPNGDSAMDETNDALRVNIVAGSGVGGGDGTIVDGDAAGEADVIGTNPAGTEQGLVVRNIPSGTQPVSAASLPLPSGAATSAAQSTGNTSLGNIDTSTSGLTGKFPAAATPADNMSNATTMTTILNRLLIFDGTNWDRAPGNSTDGQLVNLGANNDVTVTSGNIAADTELPAAGALADGAANPTAPAVAAHLMCFNGTTWDRCKGMGSTATASPQVSCTTSSATLLASNAGRFSADITMIGSGTVYVCRAATCTTGTAAFIFSTQGQSYRETTYSGVFSCITASGSIAVAGSEVTS